MNESSLRLLKFSIVGALGIAVQLGTLSILIRFSVGYIVATALAVECAVIHNFLWHRRFTWQDRAQPGAKHAFAALLRFQLSNGMISLAGNLLLMRILVGGAQLPVVPSNIATIAICFAANFFASDRWVFRWRGGGSKGGVARRGESFRLS